MTEMAAATAAAARSQAYAFLALAFADPDQQTQALLREMLPATDAALASVGSGQSRPALAAVGAELNALQEGELAAAHRRVFGLLVSGDCPPCEGEYGNAHIFQKTQSMADNAGFLRAFGLEPAPGFADRLDHISVELEFLHVLAAKEAYALARGHGEEQVAIVRDAARSYLKDHLGLWAPTFAARLEAKAEDGPYAALARLLAAFIAEEASTLGVALAPLQLRPVSQSGDERSDCEGCAAATAVNPVIRGEP
ncbi:MAG: molecular chaperone TorD family protein [Hyphomicrobiaceae bacterium]|nr:MAG: molecular chaperone TorD family protein [Hyphomicrobiaceae bacterium]